MVVGVLESSWVSSGVGQKMPSWETLLEEQKWEGTSRARVWAFWRKLLSGELKTGSSLSRKDQRLYLGPWEQSKSCYLQQEPLPHPSKALSRVPAFEACRRPPSTAPAPALGCC